MARPGKTVSSITGDICHWSGRLRTAGLRRTALAATVERMHERETLALSLAPPAALLCAAAALSAFFGAPAPFLVAVTLAVLTLACLSVLPSAACAIAPATLALCAATALEPLRDAVPFAMPLAFIGALTLAAVRCPGWVAWPYAALMGAPAAFMGTEILPQRRWALLAVGAVAFAAALAAYGFGAMRRMAAALEGAGDDRRNGMRNLNERIATMEEREAQQARNAQLAERTRIAREIHDNVGHLLTRAIMQAQAAHVVACAAHEDASAAQLEQIKATLDEAMTMVRASVHDLNERGTDFRAQIEQAASLPAGAARVHLDNRIASVPAPVAHFLATAIREALTNVGRHSDATDVTVTLRELPSIWQLAVCDNGTQCRRAAPKPGSHDGIGLLGIEQRARQLGGAASCGPTGDGWRVFAAIPKPERPEESGVG